MKMKEMADGLMFLGPGYEIESIGNEWIDAEVVGPEAFKTILFQDAHGIMYIGTRDKIGRYLASNGEAIKEVIAWMPAPKPFKKRS